jgi:P27 family predicted phage terminase small subunit
MARSGPGKMPSQLKVLHGETRAERLNKDAPKPNGGLTMPSGMCRRAKAVWRHQVRAMSGTGVLTAADTDCLRAYCEAVARYEEAAQMLAETGPLAIGQKGNDIRHPLGQIVRDNALLIRQFARDLGFLPSAREGLHVAGEGDDDPLAQWMDEQP